MQVADAHLLMLSPDLCDRVNSELGENEKLLWVGQPLVGRIMLREFGKSVIGIAGAGVAFGTWFLWSISQAGANRRHGRDIPAQRVHELTSFAVVLFGATFAVATALLLTLPLWAWRKARRVVYALTNQRAIIWDAGWLGGYTVRSYGPSALRSLSLREKPDGSGDLVFEEFEFRGSKGHVHVQNRGFMALERVRHVQELVRSTLLKNLDTK